MPADGKDDDDDRDRPTSQFWVRLLCLCIAACCLQMAIREAKRGWAKEAERRRHEVEERQDETRLRAWRAYEPPFTVQVGGVETGAPVAQQDEEHKCQ